MNGNWKEAAKLYTNAKAYKQAIQLYGEHDAQDQMNNLHLILKVLDDKKHIDEIKMTATIFKER